MDMTDTQDQQTQDPTITDRGAAKLERERQQAPAPEPSSSPDVRETSQPDPGQDTVRKLGEIPADAEPQMTAEQSADATEWFLSDDAAEATDFFELNVAVGVDENGNPNQRWIRWGVKAIDRDRVRAIRKQSTEKKRRGPGGEETENDSKVNLRIAAEGTIEPDLGDPMIRGRYADPAEALSARFKKLGKSGLIDQIAGRVLGISGYDDDDVREVTAAKN